MNLTNFRFNVTPEGRDGIWLISTDEARRFCAAWRAENGETIHSMVPSGQMMLGADSTVASVLGSADLIDSYAGEPEDERPMGFGVTTCLNIPGHNLVCASMDRLEGWDVGDVSVEDDLTVLTREAV